MKLRIAVSIVSLAAIAGLAACNTGSSLSGGQSGFSVYLTDAPLDLAGVSAVNVTLSGVVLYPSEAGSGEAGGHRAEQRAHQPAGRSHPEPPGLP